MCLCFDQLLRAPDFSLSTDWSQVTKRSSFNISAIRSLFIVIQYMYMMTCFLVGLTSLYHDIAQVSFSPDCSMIAAGGADGSVFVWDALNGELQIKVSSGQGAAITSVCWKESGFLSCDKEGNVITWG